MEFIYYTVLLYTVILISTEKSLDYSFFFFFSLYFYSLRKRKKKKRKKTGDNWPATQFFPRSRTHGGALHTLYTRKLFNFTLIELPLKSTSSSQTTSTTTRRRPRIYLYFFPSFFFSSLVLEGKDGGSSTEPSFLLLRTDRESREETRSTEPRLIAVAFPLVAFHQILSPKSPSHRGGTMGVPISLHASFRGQLSCFPYSLWPTELFTLQGDISGFGYTARRAREKGPRLFFDVLSSGAMILEISSFHSSSLFTLNTCVNIFIVSSLAYTKRNLNPPIGSEEINLNSLRLGTEN